MVVSDNVRQLIDAEESVGIAITGHYLGYFDDSEDDSNIALLSGPLAAPMCRRLVALQYLESVEVEEQLEGAQKALKTGDSHPFVERFGAAVALLQHEAGLSGDAWLGRKTFDVIQQVFSFEEPTHLRHWYPKYRDFFNRALYARLSIYALVPAPAKRFFEDGIRPGTHAKLAHEVGQCLAYWQKLASFLNLPRQDGQDHGYGLVEQLFDTDNLTRHLAAQGRQLAAKVKRNTGTTPFHFKLKRDKDKLPDIRRLEDKRNLGALALRFLMSHARVEAWLHGYGRQGTHKNNKVFSPTSAINGSSYSRDLEKPWARPSTYRDIRLSPELRRHVAFWDDAHRILNNRDSDDRVYSRSGIQREIHRKTSPITHARVALRTIEFAHQLSSLPAQASAHTDSFREQLQSLSKRELSDRVWKTDFGSSLIDGARRAAHFVVSAVRGLFNFIKDRVILLIRALKSTAVRGLQQFKAISRGFADAVRYITRLHYIQSEQVNVFRDRDFDFVVQVAPGAPPETLSTAHAQLTTGIARFKRFAQLLGGVVKAVKLVAGMATFNLVAAIRAIVMLANLTEILSGWGNDSLSPH